MYNQHTRKNTTNRHRSLIEMGGRKALVGDKGLAHTYERKKKTRKTEMSAKPDVHKSKEKDSST